MEFLDDLASKAEDIAGKVGLSPEQVKSLTATIQEKLGDGSSQTEALEAAEQAHGVPVDKIQEMLGHAGEAGQGLLGGLGNLASGFLKR